jgi:hypothetical protein
MRALEPAFGTALLLRPCDGVATTRDIAPNTWEPATFIGYVTGKAVSLHNGKAMVMIDNEPWEFRNTQTLAIWFEKGKS